MNGWYTHDISKFPPSDKITPLLISFHLNNPYLAIKNKDFFKKHEPVGCRDLSSMKMFRRLV